MARKRAPGKKAKAPAPRRLRSGYEGKVCLALDRAGVEYTYESEKIPYVVPETTKRYLPDFSVITKSGKIIRIEAKGRWLSNDRVKLKMVIQQNPDLNLRLLFQRDQAIRKGSKTLYSMAAEKMGIVWAVSATGVPPQRWLEE